MGGYWRTIFYGSLIPDYLDDGILKSFNEVIGYYDESPWKIPNLSTAINEINNFNTEKVKAGFPTMFPEVEEVRQKLLSLLETAQAEGFDVYIEYD